MIRIVKSLAILAALAVAGAAFGQGAILHDTASVEIVDMPAAFAMGARLQAGRFAFNFNHETGRLTLRPDRDLALARPFGHFSLSEGSLPIDASLPVIAREFCSLSTER